MKNYWPSLLALLIPLLVLGACKGQKELTTTTAVEEAASKWQMPNGDPVPAKRDDRKSLLWEISGNGLPQPSYLYGTIHLIEKRNFTFSDLAKDRFDRTSQLALEIDMDDPGMLLKAMSGMMMADGMSLEKLYSAEDYQTVKSYFVDSIGMGMLMVERMKPILLTSLMLEQGGTGEEMVAYETELMAMAQTDEKEILGLETAEYQMGMLDSIPLKVQAEMLLTQIRDISVEGENGFEDLVALYLEQDIDKLYSESLNSDADLADYEGPFLITRNKNWIPVIETMSRNTPTFFAVGAAHLGGDYGVIKLLQEAGFTMTPLKPLIE